MDWNKYFDLLIDWKKLPAYRLEPRIDSFIGYYLPEIIAYYRKAEIIDIIPEFPIRRQTIDPDVSDETSFRADFLLISKENPNFLVEVKTDSGSRRECQDLYLSRAKEKKLGALISGIKSVYGATKSRPKYEHLIEKLKKLSLLDKNLEYIGKNEELEIIYIQPSNKNNEENIIDFKKVAEWLSKRDTGDPFERCLQAVLLKWTND